MAEKTVYGLDYNLDDIYVLPLVEAAYIVGLGSLSFVEDGVYGTCVVYHV